MPDPTRTAIGTWSGGRFMHFGEPLDGQCLAALLRPDERLRTVINADAYGTGDPGHYPWLARTQATRQGHDEGGSARDHVASLPTLPA